MRPGGPRRAAPPPRGSAERRPTGSVIATTALCVVIGACGAPRGEDYFRPPVVGGPPDVVTHGPLDGSGAHRPASSDAASFSEQGSEPGTGQGSQPGSAPPPPPETVPSFVGLVRALSPSVVNVYTREPLELGDRQTPDLDTPESLGTSLGSGLVLDADGHLVTNAHVVENAAEIRVRTVTGATYPAGLVGVDPIRDLALLKVDGADGLVPVIPGDSDRTEVGSWVIAIGNPMGLSHTVTKGIVSGRGRNDFATDRPGYVDLLQIDAAINRGSSGGPVFDMQGRIIGMATATTSDGYGIGFVIGWSAIEDALPRLRQGGYVSRSWLGVYVGQAAAGEAGLKVEAVVSESPAARAGLHAGDRIIAFDGRPCRAAEEFRVRVATAVADRPTGLTIERDGARLLLEVTPEEARGVR